MTEQCKQPAAYRYTWPGKDEALICEVHVHKLQAVASAMGLPLRIIPIEPTEATCQQQVSQ